MQIFEDDSRFGYGHIKFGGRESLFFVCFCFFEIGSCYVDYASLKLEIFLP
jgi:hypothetical protein